MTIMADVTGDERAAGVVNVTGSDPYRELELYLEKVNEEFGEVFERWLGKPKPPTPPIRTKRSRLLYGAPKDKELGEHGVIEWSDSLINDFDAVIARELTQLEAEVDQAPPPPPTPSHLPKNLSNDSTGSCQSDQDSGLCPDYFSSRTVDAGTQTSPTLSSSSSFTWLSDCSSSRFNKSETESECSSSSLSLCNYDASIDSSPDFSLRSKDRLNFHGGEETWIRRESVYTQTTEKQETTAEDDADVDDDDDEDDDDDDYSGSENKVVLGRPPLPGGSLPRPYLRRTTQLPSPSSASLKLANLPISAGELLTASKSSSAPIIMKKLPLPGVDSKISFGNQLRSHSERHLSEIEASEACKWLRAAGFPQYAQMFQDVQFPIEVDSVAKDHPFLDTDSLQSLFRRLHTLNRCANIKIDASLKKTTDSDDEEQCALSDNWTFLPASRRWSRIGAFGTITGTAGRRRHRLRDTANALLTRISRNRKNSNQRPNVEISGTRSLPRGGIPLRLTDDDYFERLSSCSCSSSDSWYHERGNCRSMSSLSTGQLLVLSKLALLKLTACLERHCPHRTGFTWDFPKLIRKIKPPDYRDKAVFGVPLFVSVQRSGNGEALPGSIQNALQWLRGNALHHVGLFRKSGVRSRIHSIKMLTEEFRDSVNFDDQQAYDVADMVKQYFRELPEALVTNKLSETLISIFQYVPVPQQNDALQWAMLLLPDHHREAVQTVVEFLHDVSMHCDMNQMTPSNLAVCLAPSLFHLTPRSASTSPRRRKVIGAPDQKELDENKAAHDCLVHLIRHHKSAFTVSEQMFTDCRFSTMEASVPMTLNQLGLELKGGWRDFMNESINAFLKELRDKSRGWVNYSTGQIEGLADVAYKKVGDGHPLRLWRVTTEVEAPPGELLRRVLRERHVWDPSLLKWRVVQRLDAQAEIFQFVCASLPPLPSKDYCVLRSWRGGLAKGAYVLVETSVEHGGAPVVQGGVRAVVLASRYLIEPCGMGKSRIVHLSRVDTKGRAPTWYNKSFGHICAQQLANIRASFRHPTDGPGPESKV